MQKGSEPEGPYSLEIEDEDGSTNEVSSQYFVEYASFKDIPSIL